MTDDHKTNHVFLYVNYVIPWTIPNKYTHIFNNEITSAWLDIDFTLKTISFKTPKYSTQYLVCRSSLFALQTSGMDHFAGTELSSIGPILPVADSYSIGSVH